MWIMWKTYPHFLWITDETACAMWIMWISYPHYLWITLVLLSNCGYVDKLSTLNVDNLHNFKVMWKTYPHSVWISRKHRLL